jgi:hypothetical protein
MLPEIELVNLWTSLPEFVTRMMASSHSHFFVVENNNEIRGHISLENLRPIFKEYENLSGVVIASDLMDREVPVVNPEEPLDMVMQLFERSELDEIPVVEKGELIGTVWRSDVIKAYNREIFKLDMASGLATSLSIHQKMHSKRMALEGGFLILEVAAPQKMVGKNLETLQLRQRYGATVLAIKREEKKGSGVPLYIFPQPSSTIREGDRLVIFGLKEDLSQFPLA